MGISEIGYHFPVSNKQGNYSDEEATETHTEQEGHIIR